MPEWDGTHDPTGEDHLRESVMFSNLGGQLYDALVRCVGIEVEDEERRLRAVEAWETRP